MSEFARRAEARDQNLVMAGGLCDPQTGATDPYLLFRELLTMLTGDVEARLAQGAISNENARRLQQVVRTSIESLVDYGPDLIGLLVPGANLAVHVAKIGIEASKKAGLMARLQQAPPTARAELPVRHPQPNGTGLPARRHRPRAGEALWRARR